MFPQMRRAAGLAAVRRAAGGIASADQHHRLFQAALFTSSSANSSSRSHWFSYNGIAGDKVATHAVFGTMLFSTAATAIVEEAQAKETVKFRPKDVVLYQYEACPFCNKVKAFLDYYDIPYKVVEVNPLSKKETKWSEYKKVPILMVDGVQMVDSSDIIDKLYTKVNPGAVTDSAEESEEKKWRRWVDNHLVHILSPNIYRSISEAIDSFDYITTMGNFSFMEKMSAKYVGAGAMYFISKRLKKRHNITDERAALYEAAETWVDALQGRDFLGGAKPNLADLAVFGVLKSIRYLRAGQDMVQHTRIGDWYDRMENAVGVSAGFRE
ncbi:prostaglandin E synthase 2-like [Salvia splendens]|uniref:prostaglandin E synthase 2-like n=1 Tax=Salvia splendens TaxID=180675 RepID=UPI001C27E8DB|nr:prostaglandin E synthase 2-like [Salvia splendens]